MTQKKGSEPKAASVEKTESTILSLTAELAEARRGIALLHAELEERAAQLQHAHDIKSHFLSHMTHEFRTPVNSILSLTRFLLDRTDGELTDEQERQIVLIRKSGERLSGMVNDLLDLAYEDAQRITLSTAPCTGAEIFTALQGIFDPLMSGNAVKLSFSDPGQLPPLHSDPVRITQILRQLISNAIKYTQSGEIRVEAAVTANGEAIIFSVTDTGIGIAAEDHERIFEHVIAASRTAQHRNKGSGLGLPLARKLAVRMGGSITVDSSPGQGARFTVTLPCRLANDGHEKASPSPADGKSTVRKALILDDEETSYYMLKRALKDEGYDVLEAATYDEAAALAHSHRPDVMFIDMLMPQMTGIEAIELLRKDSGIPAFPIILHSHKTLTDTEKSQLSAEVHDILSKEIALDSLRIYLKNLKTFLTDAA